MNSKQTQVFTLMVDNEFGVLTRITALIRRSGWNIRSLAVAETAVREVSRLTVCLECRHHTLESVLERLRRLNCIKEISIFSPETQVARELALLRLKPDSEAQLRELCGGAHMQIIQEKDGEYVLSVNCEPHEIDALLENLGGIGLLDFTRTGTIALKMEREAAAHEQEG